MKIPVQWQTKDDNCNRPTVEIKLISGADHCFATIQALIDWNWPGYLYVGEAQIRPLRLQANQSDQSWRELNPLPFQTSEGYIQLPRWRGKIQLASGQCETIEVYQGLRGMDSNARIGAQFLKHFGLVVIFDPEQQECSLLSRQIATQGQ